ncbi:hypothetical protein HanRHA438_Chr12g0569401 [Helianthus annuus]|nr:hypothetical protein HanRHA438_Chr12g0569401 [Helianthus annuus]
MAFIVVFIAHSLSRYEYTILMAKISLFLLLNYTDIRFKLSSFLQEPRACITQL